jgi:hypothetical protein
MLSLSVNWEASSAKLSYLFETTCRCGGYTFFGPVITDADWEVMLPVKDVFEFAPSFELVALIVLRVASCESMEGMATTSKGCF